MEKAKEEKIGQTQKQQLQQGSTNSTGEGQQDLGGRHAV